MRIDPRASDGRTASQVRAHYEIETALAARLRQASKSERRNLYTELYDELFRRVPDHPMLRPSAPAAVALEVERQLRFLRRFLSPRTRFLEIGPGACALSFAVARRVRHVHGVEVSTELSRRPGAPENFTLHRTDGSSIDLPESSIDVAYSYQLMEHLHPEDALDQLHHIYRVLIPGGRYVCVTPNRLSGPWDVSMHFDRVATGFHLHEYTVDELRQLLHSVGFRRVQAYVGARGRYDRVPIAALCRLENGLARLPETLRWKLAHTPPLRLLLGMRLVARK